eukprot:gene13851-18577_t
MSSLIFNFPLVINKPILSEWLDIADISRLDISCCERSKRKSLLAILKYPNVVRDYGNIQASFVKDAEKCLNYFQWCILRGINLDQISLYFTEDTLGSYLIFFETLSNLKAVSNIQSKLNYKNININSLDFILTLPKPKKVRSNSIFSSFGFNSTRKELAGAAPVKVEVDPLTLLATNQEFIATFDEFLGLLFQNISTKTLTRIDMGACYGIMNDTMLFNIVMNCEVLKSLTIVGSKLVTDDSIILLSQKLVNLTELELVQCIKLSNMSFRSIACGLKQLKLLNINYNNQIIDLSTEEIFQNLFKLKSFQCCRCHITDNALFNGINRDVISNREEKIDLLLIDLSSCLQIYDKGIIHLASFQTNLTHVNLGCCYSITDASVIHISKSLPKLTFLNISFCNKITDEAIYRISENPMSLESLNLSFCNKITDDAIILLSFNVTSLTMLNISDTRISKQAKVNISKSITNLQVIAKSSDLIDSYSEVINSNT